MDITVKTKFDKGDKVVVKTSDGAEKLPVFVLASVNDIEHITRLGQDLNKISYTLRTLKVNENFSRIILAEEDQMYSFEEFTKLFNALRAIL